MFDSIMRRALDPRLNQAGRVLSHRGIHADHMTLIGFGLGLVAAALVAVGVPGWLCMIPLLASRLADGLDGAIARASRLTEFGGFLDIVCDFVFYGVIPLAFALRAPQVNAVPAAFLLASFYANGASFLSFAVLAAKRGLQTDVRGVKSLYYSAGLLEGTETIAFFILICLWPSLFAPAAWVFGILCFFTASARIALAWRVFGRESR